MSTCADVVSREHVPVEMRHEQLDGVVVFRWELDDEVLHRLRLRSGVTHVRRGHEALVELGREQRVGQRAEVVLEDGRDRADVVEAVAVAQVERVVVAALEQLRDDLALACAARLPVDALVLHR
jgi:hypothetical protein